MTTTLMTTTLKSKPIDFALNAIRLFLLLTLAALTLATTAVAQNSLEIELIPADASAPITKASCDLPNFTCTVTFEVSANFASSTISLKIPEKRDSQIRINGRLLALIDYDSTGDTYTLRSNGQSETFRNWDSLSRRILAYLDGLLGVKRTQN